MDHSRVIYVIQHLILKRQYLVLGKIDAVVMMIHIMDILLVAHVVPIPGYGLLSSLSFQLL